MTRKHYILIASVIRELPSDIRVVVAKAFQKALTRTYANFDWSKFIAAATAPTDKVW